MASKKDKRREKMVLKMKKTLLERKKDDEELIKSFDFDHVSFEKEALHPENSPIPEKPYRLCVWMMVCDEEPYIEKSLRSSATVADCLVIGDTGSKDGTVRKAIEVCKSLGKPFYILELGGPQYPCAFPFFNFAAYRNRLLTLARQVGDWLLAVDASDEILGGEHLLRALDGLPDDVASVTIQLQWNTYTHSYNRLLRARFGQLEYKDARHNYIDTHGAKCADIRFCGFILYQDRGAAKSSGKKYIKDIEYFEWKLRYFPQDGRAAYYLAESFYNADQEQNAYKQYLKCTEHADIWIEERYYSHFQCAKIAKDKKPLRFELVEKHLLDAYNTIPTPLAAIELFRLYRDYEKPPKETFGPRMHQAYAWITAACYVEDPKSELHDEPRQVDEKRWALLGSTALMLGYAQAAIEGYVRAQHGHLVHRSEAEEKEEDESKEPYFSADLKRCWKKFGKSHLQLFEDVPISYVMPDVAEEIAAALGRPLNREKKEEKDREEQKEKVEEEEKGKQ